jgi:hypothetical protein
MARRWWYGWNRYRNEDRILLRRYATRRKYMERWRRMQGKLVAAEARLAGSRRIGIPFKDLSDEIKQTIEELAILQGVSPLLDASDLVGESPISDEEDGPSLWGKKMVDGKEIEMLRKKLGLSLREAAAFILGRTGTEINSVTIRLLETGAQPDIRTEAAKAIALAYGVELDSILTARKE